MYCSSEKIQTFSNLKIKCLNYNDFNTQREKMMELRIAKLQKTNSETFKSGCL